MRQFIGLAEYGLFVFILIGIIAFAAWWFSHV